MVTSPITSPELVVVMPVYNEEECVAEVVRSWYGMLSGLGISFRLLVLNDGSTDGTAQALSALAGTPEIEVIHQANSGHGPTILRGYHQAVEEAEWVFQCDSDGEMDPDAFIDLWERRHDYDALFGIRCGRRQHPSRRLLSACSRATVRLLYGSGVTDVNVPYRLMRAPVLREVIQQIPPDTFAPNVIIAGAVARANLRIANCPIPHRQRRTGSCSLVKAKLWRAALQALLQTLGCRPVIAKAESVIQQSDLAIAGNARS